MLKIIKMILDCLLIITWIIIIALELKFSGWLVLISILFWSSNYIEKVEE